MAANTHAETCCVECKPNSEDTMKDLDPLLVTRDVANAVGCKERTLAEKVRTGQFPPPDAPGHRGRPNKWRQSTVARALDSIAPKRGAA